MACSCIPGPRSALFGGARSSGSTTVAGEDAAAASQLVLAQNSANPFRDRTEITYSVPEAVRVKLTVFDVTGREIARLVDRELTPGSYTTRFDADGLPAGVYFYRLEAGSALETRKMTVLK